MRSLFPLLLQYGLARRPGSPAGSCIHPTAFLLWMLPALAAQALPPSHGTRGGEGLPGAGGWHAQGVIFAEVSPSQH